jgi:tripartite-type tricarboxylate transporter receptor subunit TctC
MTKVSKLAIALLGALFAGSQPLLAQPYPAKPVRLIMPIVPGGGTDTTVRAIAQEMEKVLGQPVVIDNRGGGSGSVGVGAVAKATPDGYTIGMGYPAPLVMLPMMQKDLPYDPWKELTPVGLLFHAVFYASARANSGFSSLKDVIAAARANPGKVSFGHGSVGSIPYLAVELLKQEAGVDILQVGYKGDPGAVVDFLGGRVDLVSSNISLLGGQVKDGSVRILFQFGEKRSQHFPNVPTVGESGFPKVSATTWVGLVAPAGTPASAIARLNEATVVAVNAASSRERFNQFGLDGASSTPQWFGEFLRGERSKWEPIVRRLDLKL